MPLAHPLTIQTDPHDPNIAIIIERPGSSLSDADSQRFRVRPGMSFWVNVDFRNPSLAKKLLNADEVVDTDDQQTIDALLKCPELEFLGATP